MTTYTALTPISLELHEAAIKFNRVRENGPARELLRIGVANWPSVQEVAAYYRAVSDGERKLALRSPAYLPWTRCTIGRILDDTGAAEVYKRDAVQPKIV